ncbi:C4-type zinc ribbon domain-containing protein [Desulfobacterales bacterium HSG16]|nr:C4-type zinc ribbon domain-containing protein [Desulfobacterales bacterium HSG16]
MKEQLDALVEIQELEGQNFKIQSELDRMPERLQQLDDRYNSFEKEVGTSVENLDEMRKACRSFDADLADNDVLIKKNKATLTTVKTNKEYQALLKGIEELKTKASKIEDEILSYLGRIESAENEINEKKLELKQIEQHIAAEKKVLLQKEAEDRNILAELIEKQEEKYKVLDKKILDIFHKVKKGTGNTGIVVVKNAVCSGCHMNIPAQMYNELQRLDSLKFCPFCSRIMYWIPDA